MKIKNKTKWIELGNRFNVAGVQYSDYQLAKGLKAGAQVRFIGEPSNPYDNKAVRIEFNGVRIGYVPRFSEQQKLLWDFNKRGSVIIGILTAVNKSNPTWQMLVVQIKATRPKGISMKEGEVLFSKMRTDLSYQMRDARKYECD